MSDVDGRGMPKVLLLQIARHSSASNPGAKDESPVQLPDEIDLAACASSADARYVLVGAILHESDRGSATSGHFVFCERYEAGGQRRWAEYNDSRVRTFADNEHAKLRLEKGIYGAVYKKQALR